MNKHIPDIDDQKSCGAFYIFGKNSHTHTHTETDNKQASKQSNQPTNKQQNHRTVHTTGHINIKRSDLTQRRCRHNHQSPFPSTTWTVKSIYLRGWWNFMATTCNSPKISKRRLQYPGTGFLKNKKVNPMFLMSAGQDWSHGTLVWAALIAIQENLMKHKIPTLATVYDVSIMYMGTIFSSPQSLFQRIHIFS